MSSLRRVHVTHSFTSAPADVFEALSEHENLGPLFGARVTRLRDGDTSRNGVGSVRQLTIGPLPAFEETVTACEPDRMLEYRITRGSPLTGHVAVWELTATPDGGCELEYTIEFASRIPGVARLVARSLHASIPRGLCDLVD